MPYRVASLEAPHGSHSAVPDASQPDASYDAKPGMPTNDWFQFHYRESLSGTRDGDGEVSGVSPLKWTMLARNQIINAHTENWVLRYLSYEPIGEEERIMWEGWYNAKFRGACGESMDDRMTWRTTDVKTREKGDWC